MKKKKKNPFIIIFVVIFIVIFIIVAIFITKKVYTGIYSKIYQNQVAKFTGNTLSEIEKKSIQKEAKDLSNVKGTFTGKQTWSRDVYITGDVIILSTLTIEPGTIITFAAGQDSLPSSFDIEIKADGFNDDDPTRLKEYADSHSSIFVVGSLIAKGTKEQPIIFTSDSKEPHYADWGGINLVGKASVLENVVVEYSRNGVSIPSPDKGMIIRDSVIRHAMWGCFSIDGSNGLFENNLAQDCGHEGFDVGGKSIIRNNKVENSHAAVVVLHGSPTLQENIFQDEVHSFPGATPNLVNNIIDSYLKCKAVKVWDYDNYKIPCFGEPYLIK